MRELLPTEGLFSLVAENRPVQEESIALEPPVVPNSPRVCHGTLSYSPIKGVQLRTYGHLSEEGSSPDGNVKHLYIHAKLQDGLHALLYNNTGYEVSWHGGTAHSTYYAEYLLYGYCKLGLHEQRILSATTRFRYLKTWLSLPGYKPHFEPIDGEVNRRKFSLIHEPQGTLTLFDGELYSIVVQYSSSVPIGNVIHVKDALSETAYVVLQYKQPAKLPSIAADIKKLERFLSLISQVDMPVTSTELKISKTELDDAPPDRWRRMERQRMHRMYHYIYPRMPKQKVRYVSLLYPYRLVKDEFQAAYQNWLELYEQLKPALDQYFEQRYHHKGYEATKHAYYGFIFEAVHKKLHPSQSMFDPVQFKSVRRRALRCIPRRFRDHIASQMSDRGVSSLKSRYRSILGHFEGRTKYFSKERIEHYAKALVDSRNLITHEGLLDDSSPVNFSNVIQYNELVKMLVTYMILNACGLEESRLLERLTDESQFTFFQWENEAM
jgi:hypothetical protein